MHAGTAPPMKTRIQLAPTFADTLARHGIGMNEFADLAAVSRQTLYALQNPSTHPWRRGGMHRTTAWKIANTFASKAGISPDEAWSRLLVEVPREE